MQAERLQDPPVAEASARAPEAAHVGDAAAPFRLGALLRRAAVPLTVMLVLIGVTLAVLGSSSQVDDFAWHFEPAWLVASVAAFAVFQLALCAVWDFLLRSLGASDLPATRSWAIWNLSLLAKYVPTSALMPLVRVVLYEREGVPRRLTLAANVYEMALAMVVCIAMGAWWMLKLPDVQGHASRWLLLSLPLVGALLLHPAVIGRLTAVLLRRFGRPGAPTTLPIARLAAVGVLYVGCFLIAGLGTLALAKAIHPVDGGDVPLVVASFAIAFVVSVLAFLLPGGLGARETGMATALAPALPFAVGLAVAVAVRLLQLALEIVIALVNQVLVRSSRPPAGR